MAHILTGMPARSPWLLRSEGVCYCRDCVYPRYLHFAEPAVQSDSMSVQSAHQIEKDFRAGVRADMRRVKKQMLNLVTKDEVENMNRKMVRIQTNNLPELFVISGAFLRDCGCVLRRISRIC